VELDERPDGVWLAIEDSGVGMSEGVLTGALLDFGTSFWTSPSVAEELPGLATTGMQPIGKFGIGFFSVFMIADHVRVITRRYDRAEREALVLEFRSGLDRRPVLYPATNGTIPLDGGTRVEINLGSDAAIRKGGWLRAPPRDRFDYKNETNFESLGALISYLVPASSVTIEGIESGIHEKIIVANDWLSMPSSLLASRLMPRISESRQKTLQALIQKIGGEGTVYGRAAIWPSFPTRSGGVLVSKGVRVRSASNIFGIVCGTVETAARHQGLLNIPKKYIKSWASKQAKIILKSDIGDEQKALFADIILECGEKLYDLPVVQQGDSWINESNVTELIRGSDQIRIYLVDQI
jgi:hypothetical protein